MVLILYIFKILGLNLNIWNLFILNIEIDYKFSNLFKLKNL